LQARTAFLTTIASGVLTALLKSFSCKSNSA
jgi:hypothetical protein